MATDFQATPEDLLAGASVTFEIVLPADLLQRSSGNLTVQLRPVTIGAFQLIMKAARQEDSLIPLLLIKESLVQPTLSLEQIKQLPLGLVNFLIAHIREISGLSEKKSN
ncbi:MAG: hypothetical protein ACKO4U_13225 [Caldilinea sp.]